MLSADNETAKDLGLLFAHVVLVMQAVEGSRIIQIQGSSS